MLWLCVPVILLLGFAWRRLLNRSEFGKRPAVKREDSQIDWRMGEAWGLFRSSRYVTSLAVLVVCYEIVSSVTDFQFSATVEQMISEPLRRDAFFGMLGQAQSLIAIVMQLLLTGLVMRRSGVGAALLVLPAALLMGTLGYRGPADFALCYGAFYKQPQLELFDQPNRERSALHSAWSGDHAHDQNLH